MSYLPVKSFLSIYLMECLIFCLVENRLVLCKLWKTSFKRRKILDRERGLLIFPIRNKGGKGTCAMESVILNIRHVLTSIIII